MSWIADRSHLLNEQFSQVSMSRYPDDLPVTDPTHLADYILSTVKLSPQRQAQLAEFLAQEMRQQGGAIYIGKDSGVFRAEV